MHESTLPQLNLAPFANDTVTGFGCLQSPHGLFPLAAVGVEARIDGLLAQVTVRQRFVNTFAERLEATYVFPLPERFAMSRFVMRIGERLIEGDLQDRAEAQQNYDDAIRRGERAALVEQERGNVFTMRVGNLGVGEVAEVEFSMAGPLDYAFGEATFRFPLVVAPRYIPGIALNREQIGDGLARDTDAVPDASRITPPVLLPGMPNPIHLSLMVDLRAGGLEVFDFASTLHDVRHLVLDDGTHRFSLMPGELLDRDFVLRYKVCAPLDKPTVMMLADPNSADSGTFLLTMLPPTQTTKPKPSDVVILLDRSGSMQGWKMVSARSAVGRMIEQLTPEDRFAVLAFDNTVECFGDGSLTAARPAARASAVEWLRGINSAGGTELAAPIEKALALLSDTTRQRTLIIATDGQVGNEDQLLRAYGPRFAGLRVFTLGIDTAVNHAFLRDLARLGGGSCDVVESADRLDTVMARVSRRIGSPLLMNISLTGREVEIETDSLTPARLPDVVPGVPLMVFGRYRGSHHGSLNVTAIDEAGQPWSKPAHTQRADNPAIINGWARSLIRELEDQYVIANSPDAIRQRIRGMSLKYGVLSRFTAFVAIEKSASPHSSGELTRIVQPVSSPEGWAGHQVLTRATGRGFAQSLTLAGSVSLVDTMGVGSLPSGPQMARIAAPMLRARSESVANPNARPAPAAALPEPVSEIPAAYLERVYEWLETLRTTAGDEQSRRRALGVLGVQVQGLIEDLESIAVSAEILDALRKLRSRLATADSLTLAMLEQLWNDAIDGLTSLKKPADKSKPWWKFW